LAAGTGEGGAVLWHLAAGRAVRAAIGCGKAGVGCRHAAMTAGSRGTAAGKKSLYAGNEGSAAEARRHCRHIRHKMDNDFGAWWMVGDMVRLM